MAADCSKKSRSARSTDDLPELLAPTIAVHPEGSKVIVAPSRHLSPDTVISASQITVVLLKLV